MDFWSDLWKMFTGDLSPTAVLLKWMLRDLLNPKPIDLMTQQYFDVLSFFATIIAPFVFIGLIVSLYQSVRQWQIRPLKEWFIGATYALALVAVAPAFITWLQYVLTLAGVAVLKMMLGTSDIEEIVKMLTVFGSDIAFDTLDTILGIIQTVFILVLAFQLLLVLVALYVSTIGLLVGIVLKFLPWIGEPLYRLGIKTAIVGVFGYLVVLLTIALTVGFGRIFVGDNALGRAMLNVLAIALAVILMWQIMASLKGQFEAVIHGAVHAYGKMTGTSDSSSRGSGSGGSGSHTDDDASDDLKSTRRSHRSKAAHTNDTDNSDQFNPVSAGSRSNGTSTSGSSKFSFSPPRASSVSGRLVTEAARRTPVPQVQAAAAAVDTTQRVQGAAQAAQGAPGQHLPGGAGRRSDGVNGGSSSATPTDATRYETAVARANQGGDPGVQSHPSNGASRVDKPSRSHREDPPDTQRHRWASPPQPTDAEETARRYQQADAQRHASSPPLTERNDDS